LKKNIRKILSEISPLSKVARIWRISTAPESSSIDSGNTIANIGNETSIFVTFVFSQDRLPPKKREKKEKQQMQFTFQM